MTKLVCDDTVTEKTDAIKESTKTTAVKRILDMVHDSSIGSPFIQRPSPQAIVQTKTQPSRRLAVMSWVNRFLMARWAS